MSGAAVSLALRNHPSIPPDTCARVQAIAQKLGYRPDPEIAKLMAYLRQGKLRRRVSSLALLHNHDQAGPWQVNPHLSRIWRGATERAEQMGFRLEEFWLREKGMTPARMRQILMSRGIDGIVVLGGPVWQAMMDFPFDEFACAAIGYSIRMNFHRACQHQYQEMFRVLERLDKLGYRRPGLVLSEDTDERTLHHYSTVFQWMQQRWPEERRVPLLTTVDVNAGIFGSWFDRHRPDVVIGQRPTAPEFLEWLRRLGAPVPRYCGFVSLDVDLDLPFACSGIRQDYERVAAATVDLVVSQIQRNERGLKTTPKVVLIEGTWVDGVTTEARTPSPGR